MKRMKKRMFFSERTKGQIWVETMVYTLIAFALIGVVLAFVKPKIEEIQDKSIIEQSAKVLENMDFVIRNIGSPGNQRVLELGISKGTMTIDGVNDALVFKLESENAYSEIGENVTIGSIVIKTEKKGSTNDITLTNSYYGEYNLTFGNSETLRDITKAPSPYKIIISNTGEDANGTTKINFEVGA